MFYKLCHVHFDGYVWLIVVSHEFNVNVKRLRLLVKSYLVRHLCSLDVLGSSGEARDIHFLEESVGCAIAINTHDLNLFLVFRECNIETLLHLPGWDLVTKLLHEQLHNIITLCVDA